MLLDNTWPVDYLNFEEYCTKFVEYFGKNSKRFGPSACYDIPGVESYDSVRATRFECFALVTFYRSYTQISKATVFT